MIDQQKFDEYQQLVEAEVERADAHRCAQMIANITTLSFLVEQGRATVEEITQRLEQVQKSLPVDYHRPGVTRHIQSLVRGLTERSGLESPPTRL